MEAKELTDSINTVFEMEILDLDQGNETFKVRENSDEAIQYPHADALIQLYASIRNNETLKSLFVDTLKKGVVKAESSFFVTYGTYTGIAPLSFYTLVLAGYRNEAIASLKKRKKSCEGLFNIIIYMLSMDYFDSAQLRHILSKTKEMTKTLEWPDDRSTNKGLRLGDIIVNLRHYSLQRKISKINIEINEDKRSLSEKIGRLGFDPRYDKLLDGIDKFINTETEQFINAGLISDLRARLESSEGKMKAHLRRMLAEHPFGTMKRAFNQGYLLLKGLRKVRGEVGFTMLAYNMRRAINIVGVRTLMTLCEGVRKTRQAATRSYTRAEVRNTHF